MKKYSPEWHLNRPYKRSYYPEEGGFFAEIEEFPGCHAQGDSIEEALKNLHRVALNWLALAIDQGMEIPEPAVRERLRLNALLAEIITKHPDYEIIFYAHFEPETPENAELSLVFGQKMAFRLQGIGTDDEKKAISVFIDWDYE